MFEEAAMKFHAELLYINDQFPDILTFRKLQDVGRKLYPNGTYLYSVEHELIADRFYWMYFQYDNAKLYSDKVIDTEDNSVKENPRPKSQVEPRMQLFACYDLENHILYVSDYSKKATITDYISEMLQKSAQTKNVLRSVDEFLNVVTQLRSVCFTQKRTLFTSKEDSIFKKQANLYGLDLPEKSKIRLDYGATPIGSAKNALRDWKMKRESGEFEDVIVVGMDDNGFENTFNFSTLISSVEINVIKDDDYRYEPNIVKTLLINQLGGQMRKGDKTAATILATLTIVVSWSIPLDYNVIASEGLTLSSIVLAVYVAAILGLINTNLARTMATTRTHAKSEFTQLGQLVIYFKYATAYAIATIVISSITLLIPTEANERLFQVIFQCISSIGFAVYSLNLFFLSIILRFMLNRQLWDA